MDEEERVSVANDGGERKISQFSKACVHYISNIIVMKFPLFFSRTMMACLPLNHYIVFARNEKFYRWDKKIRSSVQKKPISQKIT